MAPSQRTVLFLCTGNYYRSRYAEILFNSVAKKFSLPWKASSRGLALERGKDHVGPMSGDAVKRLQEQGIHDSDACKRFPESVTTEDLEKADCIVALSRDEHLPLLDERFPSWSNEVELWNVEDAPPALALIDDEVMSFVARLLGGGERKAPDQKSTDAPKETVKEPKKRQATVRVGRETKGRRGKGVTTVWDVPLNEAELQELAATLKQKCGTGGNRERGTHRDPGRSAGTGHHGTGKARLQSQAHRRVRIHRCISFGTAEAASSHLNLQSNLYHTPGRKTVIGSGGLCIPRHPGKEPVTHRTHA